MDVTILSTSFLFLVTFSHILNCTLFWNDFVQLRNVKCARQLICYKTSAGKVDDILIASLHTIRVK